MLTPFSTTRRSSALVAVASSRGTLLCEHLFVTAQGSAYHRFRRALDHRNVTEALSAATEIEVVGLVEALELTLLLADREPLKYERAVFAGTCVSCARRPASIDVSESQAVLAPQA
jgi:hypothetical protein